MPFTRSTKKRREREVDECFPLETHEKKRTFNRNEVSSGRLTVCAINESKGFLFRDLHHPLFH